MKTIIASFVLLSISVAECLVLTRLVYVDMNGKKNSSQNAISNKKHMMEEQNFECYFFFNAPLRKLDSV